MQEPIRFSIREVMVIGAILLICAIALLIMLNIGTLVGVITGLISTAVIIGIVITVYAAALEREREIVMSQAVWEDTPQEQEFYNQDDFEDYLRDDDYELKY